MGNAKWEAQYEKSYTDIPLFSEPYKIKTTGILVLTKGVYESYALLLKSHGENYLLICDNDRKLMTLMNMKPEDYLEYLEEDSEITLLNNRLFNPRNDNGIVKNDILLYNNGGCYVPSGEISNDYLFGKRMSKKDFMSEFFGEEKNKAAGKLSDSLLATGKRPIGYDAGLEKLLDEIIKDDIDKAYKKKTNINYTKFEKNLDEIIKENKEYKIYINDYKEEDPYNR